MIEANLFTEKRLYPRVAVKIPIKYRLLEDKKEIESILERKKKDKVAETIDISLGGMYIMSELPLVKGSMIRIDIPLKKGKDVLTAFAEVVWTNETGCGIQFLTMKDKDIETLKTYLDELHLRTSG